jgi:hypothetical protein
MLCFQRWIATRSCNAWNLLLNTCAENAHTCEDVFGRLRPLMIWVSSGCLCCKEIASLLVVLAFIFEKNWTRYVRESRGDKDWWSLSTDSVNIDKL